MTPDLQNLITEFLETGTKENYGDLSLFVPFIKQAYTLALREAEKCVPEKKHIPDKIIINEEVYADIIKAFQVKDQGFNQCVDQTLKNIKKLEI